MDFEECLRRGYLRRIEPQSELGRLSLSKARSFLESARKNLDMGIHDGALVMAYLSFFHAARALLFKDGWREKSHACISAYLREFYVKPGVLEVKWVRYLDYIRNLRHQTQYDVGFSPKPEEVKAIIPKAETFIKVIESILGGETDG
ncbi:HEPN domain-containing protein [Thermococcus sp.]